MTQIDTRSNFLHVHFRVVKKHWRSVGNCCYNANHNTRNLQFILWVSELFTRNVARSMEFVYRTCFCTIEARVRRLHDGVSRLNDDASHRRASQRRCPTSPTLVVLSLPIVGAPTCLGIWNADKNKFATLPNGNKLIIVVFISLLVAIICSS